MDLVKKNRCRFGLNRCLIALGLSKGTWHHRQRRRDATGKDMALRRRITSIIKRNPGYGHRPILAELNEGGKNRVNHKRLLRVLNTYQLALPRCLPRYKPSPVQRLIRRVGSRANLVKGRPFNEFEAFTTDFTELIYARGAKKAHLTAFLDLKSKWVGSWAVAVSANQELALNGLNQLSYHLDKLGKDLNDVVIHHDRDSVYTSYTWLRRILFKEGGRVSYAEHGARDNPWMESFWGRFKTENRGLIWETESLSELTEIIEGRIAYYNLNRRHSTLGQIPPWKFLCRTLTSIIDTGANITQPS